MARFLIETWRLFAAAGSDWIEDKAARLGAALAFYSILSLAPLLLVALAIAALAFGKHAATEEMMTQLTNLVGPEGASAIFTMLQHAHQPGAGIVATVLGMATLLFGASGVFAELQDALNTIWEVPPNKSAGWWELLRGRFLSFAMVLGVGFLLLVSLVLSAVISGIGSYLGDRWPAFEPLSQLANAGVSFLVVTLLFAMIFKFLPDTSVAWRDVWVGALVTAVLFSFGKFLIGLYLGKAAVGSAYGAAGSLVVLLLWIYYSSQILFFGAELTQAHARRSAAAKHPRPSSMLDAAHFRHKHSA